MLNIKRSKNYANIIYQIHVATFKYVNTKHFMNSKFIIRINMKCNAIFKWYSYYF